ncbi:ribonuclease J [Patescibacteria group bacterium]|nr:ribonuclease J [Patescibacteria group bacterium]
MNPKKTKNRPKPGNRIRVYRSDTSVLKQDNKEEDDKKGSPTLKVTVLGGNEEVGRNMTVLEYGKDIIIIDMGLQFPEEDMPGIDYIIPNISYFKGKEKNVKGVIITHGHYDHIGAIPHLMGKLGNPPIYGSPLTLGIIAKRQDDFKQSGKLNLNPVDNNDTIIIGKFKIEFFGVSHNIPGSLGVVVNTPIGPIVHTGDFKLDLQPVGDVEPDIAKIAKLGEKNIVALLSDSTNATQPGHQFTETEIQGNLEDIIRVAQGRIIIGTFASLLMRVQQIIMLAEKYNRKVIVDGYSMKTNIEIAQKLGYLKINKGTLLPLSEISNYPSRRILVLCTGAQGEGRAVLMRIANREHRVIRIEPEDTVVFSSSVVPGNERSVQRLVDTLYREGAEVINYKMMDIHAGGHAKQEDLKLIIKLINPKYFVPIEGNHSFLKIHAKVAESVGFDPKNIFVADNGQIMEFTKTTGRLTTKKVPSDYVFVDGLGVGDVSNVVLRDRRMMSDDGMLVVIATIDSKTGNLIGNPDIISRGFVYMKESKKLIADTREKVKQLLKDINPNSSANDAYFKNKIRDDIGQFLFSKTKRRPMVLPVVIEV